jgi:hypothetical protein
VGGGVSITAHGSGARRTVFSGRGGKWGDDWVFSLIDNAKSREVGKNGETLFVEVDDDDDDDPPRFKKLRDDSLRFSLVPPLGPAWLLLELLLLRNLLVM